MKTGVFVCGAWREAELCSRSWHLPEDADVHVLTWSTTEDAHSEVVQSTDDSFMSTMKLTSSTMYDESFCYPYVKGDPRYKINKGPWFWREAYREFWGTYDRIIVLRPDIFLWPTVENAWDVDLDIPVHTVNKRDELFFVVNPDGFKFLAGVFDYVDSAPCHSDKNIHDFVDKFYDYCRMEFSADLAQRFVYFLARPYSRKWAQTPLNSDMINDILQSSIEWGATGGKG